MVPGKKIRPVVFVESTSGIIPERRLRRTTGNAAWVEVAPRASVASIREAENVALSQDVYRRLKAAGLVYTRTIEQFYDPVKGMFLPDRYIKGECPVCGTKDQYGDACENCSSVCGMCARGRMGICTY